MTTSFNLRTIPETDIKTFSKSEQQRYIYIDNIYPTADSTVVDVKILHTRNLESIQRATDITERGKLAMLEIKKKFFKKNELILRKHYKIELPKSAKLRVLFKEAIKTVGKVKVEDADKKAYTAMTEDYVKFMGYTGNAIMKRKAQENKS